MPLPVDGYGRTKLPYPYSYRPALVGPTLDYSTGQTDARRPGENSFTLCLTNEQMLLILSALQAGADLIYPDNWQEIIDPFLAAREHPNNPNWNSNCSQEIILSDASTIGSVVFWPNGNVIPDGFWPCTGGSVTETMFPDLIAAAAENGWIGLSGTPPDRIFEMPDMTDRFALGDDGNNPRATGGEEEHTLTVDEMPSHTHDLTKRNNATAFGIVAPASAGDGTVFSGGAVQNTGGGMPHNNMPPYMRGVWIMRVKPIQFDITQFFDVSASNCVLSKTVNGTQFEVLDVTQCIEGSRESDSVFDSANDVPDPLSSKDCVWGATAGMVDYLVSNALELLDALDSIQGSLTGFFEFISQLGWWIPSARATEIFQLIASIAIATARLQLENEPTIDGWKCDLFCRIEAAGGTLSREIFDAWLDEDICPNAVTCPPGALAFLASAELTPNQWLFNRYAIGYANDCNNGWQTLCDCEKCVFVDDFSAAQMSIPTGILQPDGSVIGELDNGTYFIVAEFTFSSPVTINQVEVDWQRSSSSATADLRVQVPAGTQICEFDSDPIGRRTDICNTGGVSSNTVRIRIDMPAQTRLYSLRIEYEGNVFYPSLSCP